MQEITKSGSDTLPYRQIFFLCANIIFAMSGLGIVAPILPQIQAWAGVSYTHLGFFVSSFALAKVVTDVPAGIFTDRYNGKVLSTIGMVTIMAGSLLSALAPTYAFLFVGRLVAGVGSAITVASIQTRLLLLVDSTNRSQVMSYFMIARRGGGSLFPFIGGVLASFISWRAIFYFCAFLNFIGVIIALIAFRHLRKGPADLIRSKLTKESELLNEESILKEKGRGPFLILFFLAFALFVNRNGLEKSTIPLFGSQIGLDSIQIGLMLSLSSIVSLSAIFFGGRIADKYGRKPVLQAGLLVLIMVNGLFLFVNNFTTYLMVGVFFGAAAFIMGLPQVMATDIASNTRVGRTLGGMRLFNDLGTVIGPVFLGWSMENHGFSSSLVLNMIILALGLGLITIWLPETGSVTRDKIFVDR